MHNNAQTVNILQTVWMNYEEYTKKEVEADILEHKVQARVGHPSCAEFKNMLRDKLLENFPVILEHSTNKNNMFGPNVAGLRGKYVRTNLTHVESKYIPIPRYLYLLHKFVTLTEDVMFVNGLPFFITLSRKIKMFTAEYIPTRTDAHLSSSLKKIVQIYEKNGFYVNVVMMDMEFEKVADKIGNTEVNTTSAREHVG